MIWAAVIVGSLLAFGQKFAGYLVPGDALDRPLVRTAVALMPISLLAALVCVQTFGGGLDARLVGVGAAAVALALRAPFWAVVLIAAATTAAVRALT